MQVPQTEATVAEYEIGKVEKNKIEDIDILTDCNFPELKEIILDGNQVSSLKRMDRFFFRQLLHLDLSIFLFI